MEENLSNQEKKLRSRLNRVKGQINGVVKMLEEGKDLQDIGVQLSAAVSSLNSAKEVFTRIRILEESYKALEDALEKFKN